MEKVILYSLFFLLIFIPVALILNAVISCRRSRYYTLESTENRMYADVYDPEEEINK